MVPKIWNATDRIFRHFGLFFPFYSPVDPENQNFEKMKKKKKKKQQPWRYYYFTKVYHKVYIWFLRYGARRTEFFLILEHFFCPFTSLTTLKIKILKK